MFSEWKLSKISINKRVRMALNSALLTADYAELVKTPLKHQAYLDLIQELRRFQTEVYGQLAPECLDDADKALMQRLTDAIAKHEAQSAAVPAKLLTTTFDTDRAAQPGVTTLVAPSTDFDDTADDALYTEAKRKMADLGL